MDENGIVHFTDRPPEDQQSAKVDIADPPSTSKEAAAENWAETWLEEQRSKKAAEKQQKYDLATERRIAAAELGSECNTAKHRLSILKTACPVFFDAEDILRMRCPNRTVWFYGELRYIDDQKRASMITHYMQVLEGCNKAGY